MKKKRGGGREEKIKEEEKICKNKYWDKKMKKTQKIKLSKKIETNAEKRNSTKNDIVPVVNVFKLLP